MWQKLVYPDTNSVEQDADNLWPDHIPYMKLYETAFWLFSWDFCQIVIAMNASQTNDLRSLLCKASVCNIFVLSSNTESRLLYQSEALLPKFL